MARIRSVHPGLFTDADWVECSAFARLLIIGLWTHADDQGVFVWRAKEIKMTLLAGDDADIEALLAELSANGLIKAFDVAGKPYGAIRNFRKWQRPQKPNATHPLPESISVYVGISKSDPEPVSDQYDTDTGKPNPMEDVGGRKEEVVRETNVSLTEREPVKKITFEDFRRPYLKFDGLNAAREEWDAAIKAGADPQSILDGLARWNAEWERRIADPKIQFRPEHIPNAGKWLAGKGWLDPTPTVGGTVTKLQARTWPDDDPCGLRAAIIAEAGEGMAAMLDLSVWIPPKTIETRTETAADRLRKLACMRPFVLKKHSVAA